MQENHNSSKQRNVRFDISIEIFLQDYERKDRVISTVDIPIN